MGREIRRVPPNWDHPVVMRSYGRPGKQPMYDRTYKQARDEWVAGLMAWERGDGRPSYMDADSDFWEYAGSPPDREYHRPWADDEATWFQLWENVSEGTPVSPPFETKEELAQYLAENGDEWDQNRSTDPSACEVFGMKLGQPGWGIERARRFVNGPGWAPSMIVTGGKVYEGTDAPD